MLDNLTQRLGRIIKELRGEARLTDANIQEALREVRVVLLEADVALPVVKEFIAAVREKALGEGWRARYAVDRASSSGRMAESRVVRRRIS